MKGPGYVYVLRRADGWYKIGHTRKPEQRFRAWRWESRVNHYVLLPVYLVRTEIPRLLEKTMQGYFRSKQDKVRTNGFGPYREWFLLEPKDLELIESVASRFGEVSYLGGEWPSVEPGEV